MNSFKKISVLLTAIFVSGFLLGLAQIAFAANPTLSLSSTGNGDNVQINVAGDPNQSIILFAASQTVVLGTTDSNGNFSTVVSSSTYNIVSNSTVYVKTGGINGAMSNQVIWPYVQNSTTTSNLTVTPSALLLNIGQTSTVTASANYLYLLSNGQPIVANINFNANQITVQALSYGSTVANVCAVGSTTNCASITITVQNSGAQQLNFSQNNFSIVSGQTIPVTISGGTGYYTISNNSNTTAVQTVLNGSVVNLTAGSSTGSAAITVCTTDMNRCGIINANSTTVNSTAVTFSQSNPVVPLGQSTTVTIYGGTGSNFYVSSNSNPSIVQANISGNVLTLIGNGTSGTSTISICAYAGTCATLTANISSVSSNGGALSLSQTSVSILAGQSTNVIISGGSTPYSISSQNSANIFNGVVNGNTLTIYGVNQGSATANICASEGCTPLNIAINSVNSNINPPAFSQNNLLMNVGQQSTVYIAGNGNYYVANDSNSIAASLQINGSVLTVIANVAGAANIYICQNGGQCATLYVTVSTPASAPITPSAPSTPTAPATPAYVFPRYLGYGDKGADVLMLQQVLTQLGFLSATPTGHYGPATVAAVKKLQKAHGVKQTGNVGPSTKDILNQVSASSSASADTSKQQQISTIQQSIQNLLAQVAQMQGQ